MSGTLESVGGFLSKHSSGITTTASIIGLVSTVVLAVRATPEAHDILQEARDRLEYDQLPEAQAKAVKKEAVKDLCKLYLPAVVTGGLTIASIIGTHKLAFSKGEQATLGAAHLMVNQAIMDYREEVRRDVGERKEKEIYGRALEKKYEREKDNAPSIVVVSGDDSYWVYDTSCGVRFKSNITRVRNAFIQLNKKLMAEDVVTVADLYSELGIPYQMAQEKLYWDIVDGLIDEYYTTEQGEDEAPQLMIHYYTQPKVKER